MEQTVSPLDAAHRSLWSRRVLGWPNPHATLRIMLDSIGALETGWTSLAEDLHRNEPGASPTSSHQGRQSHRHVLVFLVPGGGSGTAQGGRPIEALSPRALHPVAKIAGFTAEVIREAGHGAVAHTDGDVSLVLPAMAAAASLGVVGRNGLLTSPRHGSRVSIGAISTDMEGPKPAHRREAISAFCSRCTRCARSCPANALDEGPGTAHGGHPIWRIDTGRCRSHIDTAPQGCEACVNACPFNTSSTLSGFLLRAAARSTALMGVLGSIYERLGR